jgi:hypothetical protein
MIDVPTNRDITLLTPTLIDASSSLIETSSYYCWPAPKASLSFLTLAAQPAGPEKQHN